MAVVRVLGTVTFSFAPTEKEALRAEMEEDFKARMAESQEEIEQMKRSWQEKLAAAQASTVSRSTSLSSSTWEDASWDDPLTFSIPIMNSFFVQSSLSCIEFLGCTIWQSE